jgi:hypothetical protein
MVNLLDVVETLSRLDCKETKLVEGRGNAERIIGTRDLDVLTLGILLGRRRVQAECTAPFRLPRGVGVGQVQNITKASASDNIVVTKEMTSLVVDINGHIGLLPTQLA